MNQDIKSTQRIVLIALVGFTVYWFANAVFWIPWVINRWLGIAVMILLTPCLWGFASWYCLRYSPEKHWQKDRWFIAGIFLVIAIFSDFFFFAVWRRIPDQLYHPTTFAAYGLIMMIPFITSVIAVKMHKTKTACSLSGTTLLKVGLSGILFFLITLYSVRFW